MTPTRHGQLDSAPGVSATNPQTGGTSTRPMALPLAVVALGAMLAVAGLAAMSWRTSRLAEDAAGSGASAGAATAVVERASIHTGSKEFIHPGPLLVPWRMILVPSEAPDREIVLSGTAAAPAGALPGQELTVIIYHSDAGAAAAEAIPTTLEMPLPWLDRLAGLQGSGERTRIADGIYYVVSGPGYEEAGFEVEFVRSPAPTGTM